MVVVNDYWALSKIRADRSHVVLNTYEAMPGTFTRNPDMQFPAKRHHRRGRAPARAAASRCWSTPPNWPLALMGDAIATNLFMLGYAWQQGLVPVSFEALMRAIELNGAAVEMNKKAFAWGRLAAHDIDAGASAPPAPAAAPTAGDFTGAGCARDVEPRLPATASSRTPRRNHRAAREVPDRIPGRRLRRAVHRLRGQGARAPKQRSTRRPDRADRSRRRATASS